MTDSRANLITDGRQATRADAENAQGLGDPCAEAQGTHGRLPQDRRRASQKALAASANQFPAPHGKDQAERGIGQAYLHHSGAAQVGIVAPEDADDPTDSEEQAYEDQDGSKRTLHGLGSPSNGFIEQFLEHAPVGVAAVVAPRPFVQVALQPLVRDGVMRSPNARLEQAKEPVDGLGMHVPVNVDAGAMLDSAVRVALLAEPLVRLVFVGEDHGTGKFVFEGTGKTGGYSPSRHDAVEVAPD